MKIFIKFKYTYHYDVFSKTPRGSAAYELAGLFLKVINLRSVYPYFQIHELSTGGNVDIEIYNGWTKDPAIGILKWAGEEEI